MKRCRFAWALALVAMVFGLFALASAPAFALDTGPPVVEFAILSVDMVDQVENIDAYSFSTAPAIVAERLEDTDHPDTVRLWRDPGDSRGQSATFETDTNLLAKPPDYT